MISLSLWVGGGGQTGSHKPFSEWREHDFATRVVDRLAAAIARVNGEEKVPDGEGRRGIGRKIRNRSGHREIQHR
jgi:hypothetical protein